jgi:signal transduction histidine kinase
MRKVWAAVLRRFLPQTLFGRLACLVTVAVIISHFLALKLMFQMGPDLFGPAPGARPLPPPMAMAEGPAGGMRPEPPPEAYAQLPKPPEGLDMFTHWRLWLDVAVRLSALLLVTWVSVRWLAQPVRGLADAAQALGRDIRREPLEETGTLECRDAIRVFNQMQALICRQLDERDSFVAAVSHDLRTPLTRLALRVESLPDVLQRAQFGHDIAEMNNMISITLDYMRDVAAVEPFVMLDVESLLDSMVDDYSAAGASVLLERPSVGVGCGPLRTQPQALRRCIGNLLDNAVRYAGSAHVGCYALDGSVCIEVADHGSGVAEEDLQKILQPFYRGEASRNRHSGGVGLGLSIASDIAQRLQGQLTLANRPQGGLLATLTFPLTVQAEAAVPLRGPVRQGV